MAMLRSLADHALSFQTSDSWLGTAERDAVDRLNRPRSTALAPDLPTAIYLRRSAAPHLTSSAIITLDPMSNPAGA